MCFVGCNNESEDLPVVNKETTALQGVKSEITLLNANYKSSLSSQTRMPKWLRWLIFGAADTAGAIFGGVGGACGASTLAWTVTKDEVSTKENTIQTSPELAIKPNNTANIEAGDIGYVHNSVITNTLVNNSDIYSRSSEDVLNMVFAELDNLTGTSLSTAQKNEIVRQTNRIIETFDVNKSVDEYYKELISQTSDLKQKEALEVCGLVLDGLQYVDDNNTTYIDDVKQIINNSSLDPELKATMLDGVSVANASAKLWNTNDVAEVRLQ